MDSWLVVLINDFYFMTRREPSIQDRNRRGQLWSHLRHRVGLHRRPVPPAMNVAEHVDDILCALDDAGVQRAVIAGMSGGNDRARARAQPSRARASSRSPRTRSRQHCPRATDARPQRTSRRRRQKAAARPGRSRDVEQPPIDVVTALDANPGLVEADAGAFLAFEPRLPAVCDRVPLVCSVGDRSSALRFTVARRVAARTRAPVAVVPGCGHLPQTRRPRSIRATDPRPNTPRLLELASEPHTAERLLQTPR